MIFSDYIASFIANVSIVGENLDLKGAFTPYVMITQLDIRNQIITSEHTSLWYKQLADQAIVESNIPDLEVEALLLTAEAIKRLKDGFPVKTESGLANIYRKSKYKYLIVAVIAEDPDCVVVCNHLTKELARLR